MYRGRRFGRSAGLAATLIALLAPVACDDDPVAVEEEPEVETLRLTVGTQQVLVNVGSGACTGCPLVVSNGSVVTAAFLAADGEPDPIAQPGEFRLNVVIPSNGVGLGFAIDQTNLFRGTFTATGTTSSAINVAFQLFHIEEAHDEFSREVPVIVQ
jgi:hypothetical protein